MYISYLEIPLTVVGTWFGIPLTAMALAPLVLATTASPTSFLLFSVCSAALVSAFVVWFYFLFLGNEESFYAFPHTYLFVVMLLVQCLASYSQNYVTGSGSPSSVASWYLVSYLLTQLVVLFLKLVCRRLRPALARPSSHASLRRLLPSITFVGKKGYMVFESFPSGDAAGATVFAIVLSDLLGGPWWPYLLAVGSAFGRIYFFAHHIGDVAVGAALAAAVTVGCKRAAGPGGGAFELRHAVAAMILFAGTYGQLVKRLRLTLPRQFVRFLRLRR